MALEESTLRMLHPDSSPSFYLTSLQQAYELHSAASAVTQLRNKPIERTGLSPDQHQARVNILDIAVRLMLAERDKILDEFSAAWITYRKKHGPDGS